MALCGVGSAVLFGIVFIIVVSAFADFGVLRLVGVSLGGFVLVC